MCSCNYCTTHATLQVNSQTKEIKMSEVVRINIVISPKIKRAVEREAKKMHVSRSAIGRIALNEYFERKK